MHRIIRVYSLLAVLLDPIVHVFLENTVYGVYTVHRIIRVYSMLSKEKGPYGATMCQNASSSDLAVQLTRHLILGAEVTPSLAIYPKHGPVWAGCRVAALTLSDSIERDTPQGPTGLEVAWRPTCAVEVQREPAQCRRATAAQLPAKCWSAGGAPKMLQS